MEFPRQEYWSGLHFLIQGRFPTQGLNPGLPHYRQTLYHLSQIESLSNSYVEALAPTVTVFGEKYWRRGTKKPLDEREGGE